MDCKQTSPHQHSNWGWHVIGSIGSSSLQALAAVPDNLTSVQDARKSVKPAKYSLEQCYLNPFNPSTTIRYGLHQWTHVTLTVFNTLGQQVVQLVNGEMDPGYHEVTSNGSGLSRVILYRMQAGTLCRPEANCCEIDAERSLHDGFSVSNCGSLAIVFACRISRHDHFANLLHCGLLDRYG
jgi:hypothetical protein